MTRRTRRAAVAAAMTVGALATGIGVSAMPANASACTITGTTGPDVLHGTASKDVICGLGGSDTIYAGGGSDVIYGGPGNDVIYAGYGNDTVYGQGGADTVYAGYGDDTINGGVGNDQLYGQANMDMLNGNAGDNTDVGGAGIDWCVVNDDAQYYGSCNRWAFRLPAATPSYSDVSEQWQRTYLDDTQTTWDHCLVSNCGAEAKVYCFVRSDGYVSECDAWDGFGNGWADAMFTDFRTAPECGDVRFCGGTGRYDLQNWMVIDRRDGTDGAIWAGSGTWIIPRDFQVN